MPRYLQKKRRRWYAVHEIPKSLRPVFGRARFVQSLKTDSLVMAERRVLAVVGAWKQAIASVRGEDDVTVWIAKPGGSRRGRRHERKPPQDPRGYGDEVSALALRLALKQAKDNGDEKQIGLIEREILKASFHISTINVANEDLPAGEPEAQRFHAIAMGRLSGFTEHLNEWLSTSQTSPKTQAMQRADVKRFAATFATVADVTRAEVRRWITGLMNDDGLTPKTVQRILSALRGYWRYLQSIEVAGEDHEPFDRLDVARRNKSNGSRAARQPFDPTDVLRLLAEATERSDDQVADAITLAMWTGCRIEEICALKVANVKGDHFTVEDAKTDAGRRDVPIHGELRQTMTRLIDQSSDGYVLSGLTINKYGLRSNRISSRFGNLKRGMGFGPQLVFHSLRKTVITLLREAGVPEHVTADLVGHEIPTMTYGLYAGGVSLQVKADALSKLAY